MPADVVESLDFESAVTWYAAGGLPDVSIGYVAGVAIAAAMTLIALAPPRLPRPVGTATYVVGLTVNELPFVYLYLLAASTLSTLAQGNIRSTAGWLTVGAAGIISVGLAVVAWRGYQAATVVAKALDEGLGFGWRSSIDPKLATRMPRRRRYARILFWPFPVRPRQVARAGNIRYGQAGRQNLLDVYHHRRSPADAPVLIYLHGGGYFSGHKRREARPLLYRLALAGWVVVSANYRLRPQATFPDHLIDAKKVIAWVRENSHQYGADASTLFIAGSSAGGHMAVLAALTPNKTALQPGFENVDTSITAAISLYGYYGRYYGRDATEDVASTPFTYPAENAPPIFMAHGDLDTLVPVETARQLAKRWRSKSSNPVVYAELPGGHHAFDLFHSLRFESVVTGVEAFTAWVRSRGNPPARQGSGGQPPSP